MMTHEQLLAAREATTRYLDEPDCDWSGALAMYLDAALDDLAAATTDRDSARAELAALIAESARIATKSGQALEHAAQAMERGMAERDAARAEVDDRIKWQVSAVAHLTVWRGLFDAAMEMREGHEGCVTDPACGDCFRCRFDRAVDEAIAVSADSFGFIDASDLRADLARMRLVVDAAVKWRSSHHTGNQLSSSPMVAAIDAYLAAQPPRIDDESRCAVCQWPLAASALQGCVRGNCSQRPLPTNHYAPERAAREQAAMIRGVPTEERNR